MNDKLKVLGVIPARYESSRFEGKPLTLINGIPMIKRTYTQASKSTLLNTLVVATDDVRIESYCKENDIPVCMTSKNCLTGTDRVWEVSEKFSYDLYINVQGDEPVLDPESIDQIMELYLKYGDSYAAYNLYKIIDDKMEINSNTIVKVITNERDEVMYMSRLPIPFNKGKSEPSYKQQIPIYGYTKYALDAFASRDKTLNEKHEDVELLRFVDMGMKIKMHPTSVSSIAVDVQDDVIKVENFLKQNGLH